MVRPPPIFTLFPYTTLFRSLLDNLAQVVLVGPVDEGRVLLRVAGIGLKHRSEEHTSELQSLAYLVCRLLLEKKNFPRSRLIRGLACCSWSKVSASVGAAVVC